MLPDEDLLVTGTSRACARLVGEAIDLMINNAGVYGHAAWPEGAKTQGTSHANRSSTAGLSMLTCGLAIDLKSRGITLISLAPGWTRTPLGGDRAEWPVDAIVESRRWVLSTVDPADSRRFIDLTGKHVPW